MAELDKKPRPGLRFLWLIIAAVVLAGAVLAGSIWSTATWNPKLALDLEGGTSIILEPQVGDQQVTSEQLAQAVAIIRQRVDSTGVSEAEISTQGDRNIVVNLPGNPDEQTRNLVRSSAQLAFRRVAAVGAPGPVSSQDGATPTQTGPTLSPEEQKKVEELQKQGQTATDNPSAGGSVSTVSAAKQASVQPAAAAASPSQGATSSPSATQGAGSEQTKHPIFDPQTDQSWANAGIEKQFSELDCTNPKNRTGGSSGPADKPIVACESNGSAKYVLGPVELSGDHVSDASFGYATTSSGAQTNQLAVNMTFDSYGSDVFRDITSAITGLQQPYNQFAIVLDGLVLSAPTSNAAITDGKAQITGSFTQQEAETLANQLKNGALPISFQVQSEEQISPTLGADYLQKGLLAGAIGLGLVVIYSLLQYRMLGWVTVSSLVVAGVLTYLLLLFVSWRYGYRLSLAGVAGIIVGIGMTADSFIVYFERVRDELREGRSLKSSVEVGWARAKQTIYASKAVNMLAAVILYILAVGSVRGFAFTLGLTVIVDVLVVVLFTHPTLQVLARTKFFGEGHPMSGMDPRQLGVSSAAYRGALNLDLDKARASSKSDGAYREAKKRQKVADRREEAAQSGRKKRKDAATSAGSLSLAERKALRENHESQTSGDED